MSAPVLRDEFPNDPHLLAIEDAKIGRERKRIGLSDPVVPVALAQLLAANPPTSSADFKIERWSEISFDLDEEYLIDGILPKRGVGLLYGASQTFKSFIASHMSLCLALERPWAGRHTEPAAVVYLAAEGAAGLRKRKEGYIRAGYAPAEGVDFSLLSAAPNLGTASGDYEKLIAVIEAAGIVPGLIVVDTVAKVIGGADENGAGMAQFLVTAEALAQHFGCFVLAVHHTGWGEDAQGRPRGWSGLPAALDVQLLCERKAGEMVATVTIQKLKDEPSGVRLAAHLDRVVLGVSKTGREVSTLVVNEVTEAEAPTNSPRASAIPAGQRLLSDIISRAIDEAGKTVRPFADGPEVKAVADEAVRSRYYTAIAEKSEPDDDPDKLAARKRQAFNRALKAMLDAKRIAAREVQGERLLWLI